jgi:diaminopropionate ammonia-lyase
MQGLLNAAVRRDAAFTGLFSAGEYAAVDTYYDAQPSLAATALLELPSLAGSLGVGTVMVKDESTRFGLSAFKALGTCYATARLAPDALQRGFVCATAGNHGRAVARAARDRGVGCTVFVPALAPDATAEERAIRRARIAGMRDDGTDAVDVGGSYEDAIAMATAHAAKTGATIVSDTGWTGYEAIPRDIMAGYTRLFTEASRSWPSPPDVVLVQAGVGGLLCAAASWFAFRYGAKRPFLIGCEPEGSACLLESARAGTLRRLEAKQESPTMMAGLRCAEPSHPAWPTVRDGVDAFVSIPDTFTLRAMALLDGGSADPRIAAGPSGACGIGALLALHSNPALRDVREACQLAGSKRVLAIVTEGK